MNRFFAWTLKIVYIILTYCDIRNDIHHIAQKTRCNGRLTDIFWILRIGLHGGDKLKQISPAFHVKKETGNKNRGGKFENSKFHYDDVKKVNRNLFLRETIKNYLKDKKIDSF